MLALRYNLQFFAKEGPGGEKTEPATQKKLTDARKEGQVAKSKEIGNGLGLLTFFIALKIWIGYIGTGLLGVFHLTYNRIPEMIKMVGGEIPANAIFTLLGQSLIEIVIILFPVMAVGVVVAFAGDLAQVKWRPTSKPLKPKFSKINPLKGVKRIFSAQSLVELVKSILKVGLIIWITYSTIKSQWGLLYLLYDMPLQQALYLIGDLIISLGIKLSSVYLLISLGDYIYQRWKFSDDMKMTKQEVKDEYKNAEGDPAIKGKIRQKMREVSQRRMMQALPEADVVITNPTHYAVAIKYEQEVSDAPIVIAKGEDFLAQRIKETAREHNIEIVENKPLARMLYTNVDIGEQVPPELYQAVAEVLAMVYHMKGKM